MLDTVLGIAWLEACWGKVRPRLLRYTMCIHVLCCWNFDGCNLFILKDWHGIISQYLTCGISGLSVPRTSYGDAR